VERASRRVNLRPQAENLRKAGSPGLSSIMVFKPEPPAPAAANPDMGGMY